MQTILSQEGELCLNHAFSFFLKTFEEGSYPVDAIGPLRICTSRIKAPLLNCVLHLNQKGLSNKHILEAFKKIKASKVPHILFHDPLSEPLPSSFLDHKSTIKSGNFTLTYSMIKNHEENMHVSRIHTNKELECFGQISDICFDMPNFSTYQFFKPLKNILSEESFFKPFLYYLGNKPVGIIALVLSENLKTAGAYWGAVLPEHREKGIATKMLHHISYEAKLLGYEHIVAQCADASLNIALKEGYSEHGSLEAYVIDASQLGNL